ncbi:CHAT domain-containing protein [uncultured Tenacibaculum sp.]|uniref:CHAT domain-containing protein n=1 Tax=uncultured Tenacibaculum sp. TaxID=174713 RepID=UPI00261B6F2B|nr:CHAT domain-containing protein [uncultured Tenacibaculum sp.]
MKGDFLNSFSHYKKGIDLLHKNEEIYSATVHSLNLTQTILKLKDKNFVLKAIDLVEKSANLISKTDEKNSLIERMIKLSLASLYSEKGIDNFEKVSFLYKQAIALSIKANDNHTAALAYMNIGEHYLEKQKDSALFFLTKSSDYTSKFSNQEVDYIKAGTFLNKAKYFEFKKDLNSSLENIDRSINTYFSKKNNEIEYINFSKNYYKKNTLEALRFKVFLLTKNYNKIKNISLLKEVIRIIEIADKLVEIILEDSTESSTQFSWRNDVSKIYNYGIYAARTLGNDDLQFQYLEKNKAFLLTQSINDNNYSLNLPNHIVNKEIEYKKQILELENKASINKQLKDSLFDIKFNYQNFKDSIQLAYPKHFESKQKVQLTSLDKVQKTINDNTIIISYALQDEEIIDNISSGLLISKNQTIPFAISNIDTLQKKLNLYRQLVAKPLNTKEEINQFSKVSHYLYQNLFPTKEIQELIKGKQLTIIPDNQLQNIPFEAFITDTSSNSYLIESNNISYAYSMSFSDINNNIERTQTKEFAGFAPINFENQKLTSLEYSEKEINTISNNLNGLSLTGNSVTKDSFFKNASNAKIIHLATHADISKKPVIHFSKDSLNLHELYTYKNNADLVVLSACETNLGELKKGEGILNLARGFFYSGSKSVVSSLWKVNDVATTSLMSDFYANLKNHQSKSEAINNAKRNYLKTHTLSEKSPYYWASFILIGDTTPTFESDYTIYWIIGSLLFGVLLFFLGVKTLKKKEK